MAPQNFHQTHTKTMHFFCRHILQHFKSPQRGLLDQAQVRAQSWVASARVPWMLQSRAQGGVGLFPHSICLSMAALDVPVVGAASLDDLILGRFSPWMLQSRAPGGVDLFMHGLRFSMAPLDDIVLGPAPLDDRIIGRFSPCALDAPTQGSGRRWSLFPPLSLFHGSFG